MGRCSGCGRAYLRPHWSVLRSVSVLQPSELGAFVTHWPEGACVEVRACEHCGKAIARIRRDS